MLKRICIKRISPVWLAACCMLLLSSCNDSDKVVDDSLVTLKIVLPTDDFQEIQPGRTRDGVSTPGTNEESKINTLKFFVYNPAGTAIEIYKSLEVKADWTSDDPMWDATNRALRIPVTQGTKRIYSVANWAETPTTEMPLLDNTTAPNVTTLLGFVRNHANVTPNNPPVMTASLPSVTVNAATQSMSVEFRRQIARVELWPKISEELSLLGADVRITGVKFRNLPTKAYLFPQSPVASPPSTGLWSQSSYSSVTSAALTGTATELGTKYYIPEYHPGGDAAKATEMVIRTTYNGRTLYYRLKIDPSETRVIPVPYIIERNHIYRYYLTIVGEGSASETTRSISDQSDTNLTYTLEIR